MSLFKNLSTDGLQETQDRIGGFGVLDSDLYPATIKMAYAGKSDGGANFIAFIFDANGREFRPTVYITNKAGENFFINKDDKTKKVPLPGFTIVDDICLCAVEKPLSDMDAEEKVVKIYNFEAKKEEPKSVMVLTELLGKKVGLGILKQLENKSEKDGSGVYVPTAETRESNEIDKVFHLETMFTMVEVRTGATEAKFHTAWVEKNKGQTRDKRKIKDGAAGQAGAPRAASSGSAPAASAAPKKSLFAKS